MFGMRTMLRSPHSSISGETVLDNTLQPGDRDYVAALASGLQILKAFDAEHPRMTLTEMADARYVDREDATRLADA